MPTTTNPKVDAYLREAQRWQKEMKKLREIILGCPLTEELKWGKPCYTFQGGNVVLIAGFKDYCSLIFGKGALLKKGGDILIQPTENSQGSRQIRFTSVREVAEKEALVKACVIEAIEVEKAGLEVSYKKTSEFKVPEEFKVTLSKNPALKKAFAALTPGRQRGYLLHFSAPKQAKTRESRIEKCTPLILKGQGLNDENVRRKNAK